MHIRNDLDGIVCRCSPADPSSKGYSLAGDFALEGSKYQLSILLWVEHVEAWMRD